MHVPTQMSLAALFLITLAAALAITISKTIGAYACVMIGLLYLCVRLPAFNGNPVVVGVLHFLAFSLLCVALAWMFSVPVLLAMLPGFVLPGLAFMLGFVKAMELEH